MIQKITDTKHNFTYTFDTEAGTYSRSGTLDVNGNDTGEPAFMSSFPHFVEVDTAGYITRGKKNKSQQYTEMSTEDFKLLAQQCKGKSCSFVLRGSSDPNRHSHFSNLLQICKENELYPYCMTTGYKLTAQHVQLIKAYSGAVGVLWRGKDYTLSAVEAFCQGNCRTDLYYTLSANTVSDALERLKGNTFPKGISALIFDVYKPSSKDDNNVLTADNESLKELCSLVDKGGFDFEVSFNSCSAPLAVNMLEGKCSKPCECGRFSCSVSTELIMTPCGFDKTKKYGVSLIKNSIEKIWKSTEFEAFRMSLRQSCPKCTSRQQCMGGCPLYKNTALCTRTEKKQYFVKDTSVENIQKFGTYKVQMERLKRAVENEFYYETIFISYAVIEDRMKSMLVHIGIFNKNKHGRLVDKIRETENLACNSALPVGKRFPKDFTDKLDKWRDKRNILIHALMEQSADFEELREMALEGEELSREVNKRVSGVKYDLKKMGKYKN